MKLLFVLHLYPPFHQAGAEFYAHNLAKYMLRKGHEVKVLIWVPQRLKQRSHEPYVFDGVQVYPSTIKNIGWDLTEWATHLLTHLENSPWTIQMAKMFRKPVFYISHNTWDYPCVNQRHLKKDEKYPVNVIYNSHWMKKKLKYEQRSIVLHPPHNSDKTILNNKPELADRITIINANERKGGAIFVEIARRMPNRKFMIVVGAYDPTVSLRNATNIEIGPGGGLDMKKVYELTRILLAPSAYESWGMAVTEAMANGIPVICSETPGLQENAGDAGIYVNSPHMTEWMRLHEPPKDMSDPDKIMTWLKLDQTPAMDVLNQEDIDLWCEQIKLLDSESNYFAASEKVRARVAEQDSEAELASVEKFIQDADTNYRHKKSTKRGANTSIQPRIRKATSKG